MGQNFNKNVTCLVIEFAYRGTEAWPGKINAVQNFPISRSVKDVSLYLGLASRFEKICRRVTMIERLYKILFDWRKSRFATILSTYRRYVESKQYTIFFGLRESLFESILSTYRLWVKRQLLFVRVMFHAHIQLHVERQYTFYSVVSIHVVIPYSAHIGCRSKTNRRTTSFGTSYVSRTN